MFRSPGWREGGGIRAVGSRPFGADGQDTRVARLVKRRIAGHERKKDQGKGDVAVLGQRGVLRFDWKRKPQAFGLRF